MFRLKKLFIIIILAFFIMPIFISIPVLAGSVVELENPLGNLKTPEDIGTNVIKSVLGVLGSITLLVFIFGGVMWLTSAGSPEKVKKGMNTMLYAVIGLFVIFSAYIILNTIIGGLKGK